LNVLGDIPGGHDGSRLEEFLEAHDLEAVNLGALSLEAVDQEACVMEAKFQLIG
jgi:hypothetical protein